MFHKTTIFEFKNRLGNRLTTYFYFKLTSYLYSSPVPIITFYNRLTESSLKILKFKFRKIPISINVPSEIRVYRWEKFSNINKRTGTFISYSRVCMYTVCWWVMSNMFLLDFLKKSQISIFLLKLHPCKQSPFFPKKSQNQLHQSF